MHRMLLKSKIHRATVTESNLDYEGSLTIDKDLMDAADLVPYEQVHIFNITNGHRLMTYVIEGDSGSGDICANGAAAHLARHGDTLIIASFSMYQQTEWNTHSPKLIYVDDENRISTPSPAPKPLRVAKSND